jgi:hypothetical protein
MLENETLTFTRAVEGIGWTIHDGESGKQVGAVRSSKGVGFWPRCLKRTCLAVYESEDEPLLCTVHRQLGFRETWELRDAEGQPVGKLSQETLRGRLGRLLSRVDAPKVQAIHYRDSQGRLMATLTCSREYRLTFAAESKGDPFTRMLVLGGALLEVSRGLRTDG